MSVLDRLTELERRLSALEERADAKTTVVVAEAVSRSLAAASEPAKILGSDLVAARAALTAAQNENAELRARLQRVEAAARGDAQ